MPIPRHGLAVGCRYGRGFRDGRNRRAAILLRSSSALRDTPSCLPVLPLGLESLERRDTPAYTSTLSGSTATLTGDGAADTLIIDVTGGLLRHNRSGDAGFNSVFDWNSSVAGDQTLAANASSSVGINTMGGADDTLQLGTASSPARNLLAHITISAGGAGNDSLVVDNSGSAVADTYDYTDSQTNSTGLNFTNLAVFENGELYKCGTGADTFNLKSASQNVTIEGTNGNDIVTIGNTGSMANITSKVVVSNSGSLSKLTLDDSASTGGDTVTFTTASAQTTIAGLSGGSVVYGQADVSQLTVKGGTGDDSFTYSSTDPNLTAVIQGGAGKDSFTVNTPGGSNTNLSLLGEANDDSFTFTATPTGTFAVTLDGGTGTDTLTRTATAKTVSFSNVELFFPRNNAEFAAGEDRAGGTLRFFDPNGTERFTLMPFGAAFTGGVRVASFDFTGDGIADVVAGTGPGRPTQVKVFDGATKAELFTTDPFEAAFTGGVYVAAGDITGDGVAELVITPDEGGGPRVRVFNGAGFGLLADFLGIDDNSFRGGARAAVGDIDGDGFGDLVVSAGFGGGPRVSVISGATVGTTRTLLFNDFFLFEQALRNGAFVAVGDVGGDGKADLIGGGGPGGGPRVLIFSGADLMAGKGDQSAVLANFFGGDDSSRGGIRVSARRLDGDLRADLLVGAGTGAGSRVTAYLGANLAPTGVPPEFLGFDAFTLSSGVFVG